METVKYSIVIPVFNEEDSLPALVSRLREVMTQLDGPAEVVLVDDGSRDASYQLMTGINAGDPRFKIIQFSRNFGHQIAITAGMDAAIGQAVIIMDADLQDPPEVILELVAKWREGFEVVYAVREQREGETLFKKASATLFYGMQRRLAEIDQPVEVGDFRLVDRKALDAFLQMRERNRYVRGMFSWIGFRQAAVSYTRASREAGRTHYTLRRMVRLALDGFVGFSTAPLRLSLTAGVIMAVGAFLYGIVLIVLKLAGLPFDPGYASVLVTITFLSGVQLIVIGMVGQYVARIYDEARARPLYLVQDARGFGSDGRAADPAFTSAAQDFLARGQGFPPRAPVMMAPPSHSDDGQASAQLLEQREPSAQPTPRRGEILRSPYVQGLIAFAIFLIGWGLTEVRPLVHHATWAQLDAHSEDPNFYIWCLRWWPWAIAHTTNPMFTHIIGAPTGYSLAWVTTIPPLALVAAPVTVVFGPIVSFNLLTAAALPVTAWAAFVLCRRITGKFWPGMLGGVVFGFSAYELNHVIAGQLNLTYSLLVPLMAYLVYRWHEQSISGRTFVILFGLALAAQIYLFLETFADISGMLVIGLLLALLIGGRERRPEFLRMSRYVGCAYLLALVLAAPYLGNALSKTAPRLTNPSGQDLVSLVLPRPQRSYGLVWLHHLEKGPVVASAGGYIGIPLLIVVLIFAFWTWSSRLTRFLSCMLVLILIASLGWIVTIKGVRKYRLPWAPLWKLPILRNGYPSRLMLFAFLILAIVAALWLARTTTRQWVRWLRWPLALLVVLAVFTDVPRFAYAGHSNVPPFIRNGQYKKVLKPGETVAVVSEIGNAGMLWQATTGNYMTLSGGFINQSITRRSDLPWQIQDLAHATPTAVAQFEAYVRNARLGAILLDEWREPLWVGVFYKMGLRSTTEGGVVVIPTNGCSHCRVLARWQLKT